MRAKDLQLGQGLPACGGAGALARKDQVAILDRRDGIMLAAEAAASQSRNSLPGGSFGMCSALWGCL